MRPPSLHNKFFTSLKQVDKRLQSETDDDKPKSIQATTSTDNFSSPLYLNDFEKPSNNSINNSIFQNSSCAPLEFLSQSPGLPKKQTIHFSEKVDQEEHEVDYIEELIHLLSLSDDKGKKKLVELEKECFCQGGFHSKIVGVNGPKCEKERARLDKWIEYFSIGDGAEKREPLRLAHLLLGKAISSTGKQDVGGFGEFEFPSTVEEYLFTDVPLYSGSSIPGSSDIL